MFKRSWLEVAQYKQDTAKTVEEAKEQAHITCSLCNKQAMCNESICPFMKTHKAKILLLEAENGRKPKEKNYYIVKTRPYKKSTPKGNAKKAVLNFLTRLSKEVTNRKIALAIDDASVMAELEEFESCYWILRNAKLHITAERVKTIVSKIKEENV